MREGWEIKKLKEVCAKITDGTHQTPKYFDNGVIFLSSKNVTTGKIDWDNVKYIDEKQHIEMHKRVAPQVGDILLAKNGTTGVAAMVDKDIVFDIYVSLAHIRSLGEISPEYLLYFINSPVAKSQFNKRLKGVGVPNLHLQEIREVEITYPKSLPEQKQIVSILDKAFAAIDQAKANIERNIENAKELFQSKLNEIFSQSARPSGGKGEGWEEKTLSEVCRYDKSKHNGEDLPYVGLEHIESNTGSYLGDLEPMKVKSSTFAFNSNHVLYGRLRPYLNKVLLPDFSGHCSTEIFPICTNEMLKRRFLFYWFLAPITVQKIDATWTGARMPRANMNEVINFKINIPSIEIQTKLTKELDSLMRYSTQIENKYKSKLITLEELKKSILQKAFAGELTEKEVAV